MSLYGYNIDFINYIPDDNTKKMISDMAGNLKFKAPSNSKIKITIEKRDDQYYGYCRIGSKAGIFVSYSQSKDEMSCITKLETQANQKIQLWNEQRNSEAKSFNSVS